MPASHELPMPGDFHYIIIAAIPNATTIDERLTMAERRYYAGAYKRRREGFAWAFCNSSRRRLIPARIYFLASCLAKLIISWPLSTTPGDNDDYECAHSCIYFSFSYFRMFLLSIFINAQSLDAFGVGQSLARETTSSRALSASWPIYA